MSGRDRFPGYVEKLNWVDKWPVTPFGRMLLHEQREFVHTAIRTLLEIWDQRFEAGWSARDVEAEESLHVAEARGEEKDRHRREKLAAEERVRGLTEALKVIVGPEDRGYWIEEHYRPAGGGYAGLQAIARAVLAVSSPENEEEQK